MNRYCIWFPKNPNKVRFFSRQQEAEKYLEKQTEEAYLNADVGTEAEDTIGGINSK